MKKEEVLFDRKKDTCLKDTEKDEGDDNTFTTL